MWRIERDYSQKRAISEEFVRRLAESIGLEGDVLRFFLEPFEVIQGAEELEIKNKQMFRKGNG
jgi:hypothetical protein